MTITKIILAHIASRLVKSKFPITTLDQWKSLDVHQRRKLLSFGFGFFHRCVDCKIPFTYKNFKGEPSGIIYHKGFAHGTYRMDSWFEPSDELVAEIISRPDGFLNLDEKLNSLKTRIFKPKQSRKAKMTLDKEDQAVIRGIVIPPHNELLKKISDLEAEVKTLRAQLAAKSEPAPAILPTAPVVAPPAEKPQPRHSSPDENPYATSKVLPRLREFWQKRYITAEEANRIEGILSGVPGRMTDPKGYVTRQDAFVHKRERHILSERVLAEIRSRQLVLSEREWKFVLSLYHDSAA